jgi:hemerythrin-like metal-binding protein
MAADSCPIAAWSEAYALNLPEIDSQHKVLIDLLNAAWESIGSRADAAVALAIVRDLERYARTHFAAEEVFMRALGYPHLDLHKQAHDAFVGCIEAERAAVEAGAATLSIELVRFLKDWLVDHILGADKDYSYSVLQAAERRPLLARYFKRFEG